jgi:hypothetical protein
MSMALSSSSRFDGWTRILANVPAEWGRERYAGLTTREESTIWPGSACGELDVHYLDVEYHISASASKARKPDHRSDSLQER